MRSTAWAVLGSSITATDAPIPIRYTWTFDPALATAAARYTCRFDAPFWAPYQLDGARRTLPLAGDKGVIVETIDGTPTSTQYRYVGSGFPGLTDFAGAFTFVESNPTRT